MMQHQKFIIVSLIILFLSSVFIGLYDRSCITHANINVKIILKCVPNTLFILLVIYYFIVYRITIYSFGTILMLFFCLLGDVLLGFYNPILDDSMISKMVYFISGGTAFAISRLILLFILMIKPYDYFVLIQYSWKRLLLSHIFFSIPFIVLGTLNIVFNKDKILIASLLLLYLLFGCCLQQSYAFLRIRAFETQEVYQIEVDTKETKFAKITSFIGITLFNLSDILLFVSMFTNFIPKYWQMISTNIYWIAMYCLTISIVRYPNEILEKNRYLPLNIQ